MKQAGNLQAFESELPKGIHRARALPDPMLGNLWDSIVIEEDVKTQLLSQAVLNFTLREKIDRSVIPLHGVILLTGEPGTGKTSLARGLAHRTAAALPGGKFKLLEVEPHALTSSAMGKTQKAVSDLFAQAIAEAAMLGPTIVLLDEVETLAVDRSKLSMDANPIDVHRATDAVLVQLDSLAERFPRLLILATSNFPKAVDGAFISRCDLVVRIPLPNRQACEKILRDCLLGVAAIFPAVGRLSSSPQFAECVNAVVGLDGRSIRKVVANALAANPEVAMDPNKVTLNQLLFAIERAKTNKGEKGQT